MNVGSTTQDLVMRDVINAFDANKTLIIDQYNTEASETPELFQEACSMKDVFEHFKPCVKVDDFTDEDGKYVSEELRFTEMSNFDVLGGDGNLIAQSKFLSSIKERHDNAVKIRMQLERNPVLHGILKDASTRKALADLLKGMLSELDRVSENTQNSDAIEKVGGFEAIRGFIPAATDMNPAKRASKQIFLSEGRFEKRRKALAYELRAWVDDVLSAERRSVTEYVEACRKRETELAELLGSNVTVALDAIRDLEVSYRALDLFFKNANNDRLENLNLINVAKWEIADQNSPKLFEGVEHLLKDVYDRLSLKESYSLVVIPGAIMVGSDGKVDKAKLKKWAGLAHKYKVMLVTDHDKEPTFEMLLENTSSYKDSDVELQNVIVTGNWIAARAKEWLSATERESAEKAFFVPPSTALAGKLYDETTNMSQCAGGKKFGTLNDVKGVQVDLMKSEVAALMDNHIVPMVYFEGRVMAFNNTDLYDGDNIVMREYPVVRVFDWIKKVLQNYVNEVAG